MKQNPFHQKPWVQNPFVISNFRKQPQKRIRYCKQCTGSKIVEGAVTLGSLAVIGSTLPGIIESLRG